MRDGRAIFGWAAAPAVTAAALLVGGCNTGARPGAGAGAPGAPAPVIVSVPVPVAQPRYGRPPPPALAAEIAGLQRGFGGRAGIAIRAVDDGWTVEAGARQKLPQQSVSKLWVAMTLLDLRDQGKARLDDPIVVRPEDLTLFHQPIEYLVKGDGFHTTVGDLLARALTHSDNTANDRLLSYVGGPPAVRRMIAEKQLGGIRFGPGERLLQSQTAGLSWDQRWGGTNGFEIARSRLPLSVREAALDRYVADPPDGAEPLAIADAIARLARGELLSETSTRVLIETMGQSVTGRARLRAALPPGWTIAHKTGTGQELGKRSAGFNDVGLLTAPDGRRFALAVLIGDSERPINERQQLIQNVARAVTAYAAGG